MSFPYGPITTRNELHTIEEGQKDWSVAALQINLVAMGHAVIIDGDFGPQTKIAVVLVQDGADLRNGDGKVGPLTSRFIALSLMWPAQFKYKTPPGLGRGILEGESNNDLACVSGINFNGTRDVSAWQLSIWPLHFDDELVLLQTFDAKIGADQVLRKVRKQHDLYAAMGCAHQVAWKLGTLYHNRPADADRLAKASIGDTSIDWSVISDSPGWFTIGGVSYSNREWDAKYVADKTKYCTW